MEKETKLIKVSIHNYKLLLGLINTEQETLDMVITDLINTKKAFTSTYSAVVEFNKMIKEMNELND